jgi:Uma2 family endonuclease
MMSPASDEHAYAAGEAVSSLRDLVRKRGVGRAIPDNVGFLCDLPLRKSFSPDAAYYTGPRGKRKFYPQAPDFAVEIRSEDDYGPAGERERAERRIDYFAAGTKVVWDVICTATTWSAFIALRRRTNRQSIAAARSRGRAGSTWLDDAGGRTVR